MTQEFQEELGVSETAIWLALAIAVLAAAGGFWAGFRFMARRQPKI
jgi:hypothetical protein